MVQSKPTNQDRWYRVFFGARSRILISYVVLMAFFTVVSILAMRQVLLVRQEKRIENSLRLEAKEFQRVVNGINPATGKPFGDDVISILDKYLSRNFPEENEFFIALFNGQFYKSNPTALPNSLHGDSKLLKQWAQLTERKQGKKITSTDTFIYLAEPVIRRKNHGVMVMVHSTVVERQQVDEVILDFIRVSLAVLLVASILAWLVAGQVLAPLRLLTDTARSITDSDLTRRISVKGKDEIAELTITFNEMLDRLQAAFKSQRNFIDDASHELRTPITIIRGHLELVDDDPQERQETMEIVIDELDRMNRFVDDMLLLAQADQPNFLYLETVEIGALTEELFTKAKALANNKHWRLENKGMGRIVADRQRLTQAIMNLAHNATQHTTQGDIIALGSALSNNEARFWVRDTGVGITFAEQQRIFERFARVGDGRRSQGAGLGLTIVRAIAQAHGGQVEILSQLGSGSTFTIVIPLEPPQEFLSHE